MSGSRVAVTPEGIRDADQATCEAVCARRGPAVLAYCEQACAPGMAGPAAAEAFARFRAAVIATPDSAGVDPDALLMSATRHAAAARAPRQRAISARVARSLGSSRRAPHACDLAPELLAARAEALLSDADRVRLSRHLQRCAFCRAAQERFGAAEAAYRNPPPGPVPPAAHDAIMRALLDPATSRETIAPAPVAPPGGPPRAPAARAEDLIDDGLDGDADPAEIEREDDDPFAAAMADVAAAMPDAAAATPAPWVDDEEGVDRVIAVRGRSSASPGGGSRGGSLAVASPAAPRGALSRRERRAAGRATRDEDPDGVRTGTIGGAPLSPLSVGTRRRPLWALALPLAVILLAAAVVLAVAGVFGGHGTPTKAPTPAARPASRPAPVPAATPTPAHASHDPATRHHHHTTAATIALPPSSTGGSGAGAGASAAPSDPTEAPTTSAHAPAAAVTPAPAPVSSTPPDSSSGGSAPSSSVAPTGGGTAGGTSPSPGTGGSSVDGEGSSTSAPPPAGGTPADNAPAGTYQPSG